MSDFVHLHVHSEYSLLDGLPQIKKLVKYAGELKMSAVALTDHGVLYGAIEFYKACLEEKIKPILGFEGYVTNQSHKKKEEAKDKENNHLILIAKNFEGYQNLMKISTTAFLEGFYYRPRFDKETLRNHAKGLICLSSCMQGEVGKLLSAQKYEKAKETASWYREIFGDDYYLEIQRHKYEEFLGSVTDNKIKDKLKNLSENEKIWVGGTIKLSRELGIPLVATNDVHYLRKEDAFAQDVLVCISTGKIVTDIDRMRYVDTPTFQMRSPGEMKDLFADVPDAVENTLKVAEKVDLKIELGKWLFPSFEIPQGKKAEVYLKELAYERFPEKYEAGDLESKRRLDYELDVIIQKGYASYFLIMQDLVNWCTHHGIITNTRGSAAGSIVSYVIGITTVDPVKYSLPFERFLNPFRPKPPDIDLDIAGNRREELLNYILKKYGGEKTAQICTFGRMMARAAVRDVGRVLGYPYAVPDRIAKLIPLGSQGFPMAITQALKISPELKDLYDHDPDAKKIMDTACEIEGNARHSSVHAAGIVIAPGEITDYCPLQIEAKEVKIITQYEMHACEDVGLVKFDILGLENLSILNAAVEIIEKSLGKKIDLSSLPLDDKKTFAMLARGQTMGVFQLGGAGMTKWLKELHPSRIEDIMIMIALFRPGPIANIPEFIARRTGKSQVKYLHPKMENFADKSLGILVYQEDVLFTAMELAGYNWESVDKLRNAIGKKIPSEMTKQHEIFVEGCQKHSNLTREEAEKIWDLFVPFQGYGFNKAHAASYGFVSYQTAYLKAHYPVEYMTALLTAESNDTDKVTEAISECRRMGIIVMPPDINTSESGFTIEENEESLEKKAIRFGLSAIKNVGIAAIEAILGARENGLFSSLSDFCQRVDSQKVNKKVLESLIKVGAMDRFGHRASLLVGLDQIRTKSEITKRKKDGGQASLFEEREEVKKIEVKDDLPNVEEFSQSELLGLEKELLGLYLTEHPLSSSLSLLQGEISHKIYDLSDELPLSSKIKIGGIISSLRTILTKKSNAEMIFATIEDETGKVDVVVFPKVYEKTKSFWVKDKVVLIEGKFEFRDNTPSVLADNVFDLETLKQDMGGYDFILSVPKGIRTQNLLQINSLLKENRGDKKGVLLFGNNGSAKKIPLNFGVNFTQDLEKKIKEIISS